MNNPESKKAEFEFAGAQKIAQFPITSYLKEICDTLKGSPSRFLILTGKSTHYF